MLSKILMPSGGQTTDELVILQWEKKVGDFIRRGDILFEIETDKANLTVESFAEGTLLEITYGDGAHVRVGETVAYIGEATDELPSSNNQPGPDEKKPVRASLQVEKTAEEKRPILIKEDSKVYASPLAKSQARVEKINLDDVSRFVSKKLIKKDDIVKYVAHIRNGQASDMLDSYFVDVTSMRKTIARRMKESVLVSPHYVLSVDIDMTEVVGLRRKLNDNVSSVTVKISYNDFIMKVVAKTIAGHPFINSSFQEDRIRVYKNVNFGLAIAVEAGLVVPVIKNVNHKSLSEIAQANAEIVEKVRSGKIGESDISGGTITLSNLGMYGMKEFTAIINQPESCILAIGAIIEKPVSIDREVKIRDIMNITGSFDHRVIDGAVGAAFLQDVKKELENPHLLVL
ncbi:MAG: dihydrolipoamide acetyltransferase family protein [Cyclobacteriaceae bacterium]